MVISTGVGEASSVGAGRCAYRICFDPSPLTRKVSRVGETVASCYRGRLLQGRFMQNYNTDGEIANSSCIIIQQRKH